VHEEVGKKHGNPWAISSFSSFLRGLFFLRSIDTETTPEAGQVSYHTTNDQLASSTNANGKTTTFTYDKRNLPTTINYSDGTTPNVGINTMPGTHVPK
jgi:YD repeat-containing protein